MTKEYEWNDEIFFESDEVTLVTIHEDEPIVPEAEPEPEPEAEPETEEPRAEEGAAESEPAKPKLTTEQVRARLAERKLHAVIAERLAERAFADLTELDAAIEAEVQYIKAITESGKPFGMGHSERPAKDRATLLAERDAQVSAVNKKFLG